MKRGDRIARHGIHGAVVDLHPDKIHVSVLPDLGRRALVRWRLAETETVE